MSNKINRGVFCFVGFLVSFPAVAVDPSIIKVGNVDVVPTLGVNVSRDDNIFRDSQNEIDSQITIISPNVQAILQDNANRYVFSAEATNGNYAESDDDDYTDWRISGQAQIELNSRNKLDLTTSLLSSHETRGTGFSEGSNLPQEPDEFEVIDVGLLYQFGATDSRGRIELALTHSNTEYSNNRLATITRDLESDNINATFFLNVLPRTSILFEYRHADIDYTTDITFGAGSLDSRENYAFIGAQWEASARTTGSIRIGYGEKDFTSPLRADTDIPSWEADIQWSPLSYSTFSFTANSRFEEATGTGDAIENESYGVSWNHTWSSRFNSNISARHSTSSFSGRTREDETDRVSIELGYAFTRWLDFSLSFSTEQQDSGDNLFEYEQGIVALGFVVSL